MYSRNRYYSIYDFVCSTITQLFMYVYLEQSRLHRFSSYKQHEVFDKHKNVHTCLRKKRRCNLPTHSLYLFAVVPQDIFAIKVTVVIILFMLRLFIRIYCMWPVMESSRFLEFVLNLTLFCTHEHSAMENHLY